MAAVKKRAAAAVAIVAPDFLPVGFMEDLLRAASLTPAG
jgi:hypothetical protein